MRFRWRVPRLRRSGAVPVRFVLPSPLANMVQTLPAELKAIMAPFGDHAGSIPSFAWPVVTAPGVRFVLPEPSAFITNTFR